MLGEEQFVAVLNVTGMAGIGKSTLVEEFAKIARDNDAYAVVVNARTLAAEENLQVYPPAVQVLSSIARTLRSQHHDLRGFTSRLDRYTNLYWDMWHRFEGDEQQAVGTMLQVGAAAVRAGSTVLPVAKPLDAILTPELTTRLAKAIGGYRRKADRQLLTDPVQQLTEAFVRNTNSLTGGSRRLVIVLDEFELTFPQTEHWLRTLVAGQYGEVEGGLLVVVAGRRRLGHDWTARGNTVEVEHLPLDSFTESETSEYLEHNVPDLGRQRARHLGAQLGDIFRVPLVLRLLASQPGFVAGLDGGVDARFADLAETELVHRLLDDTLIDEHQRSIALRLAVPRTFNARVLAALAPDRATDSAIDTIESLISNGFVNANAPRYTYYELLRTVLLRYLKSMDAGLAAELHGRLAELHRAALTEGDENQARTVAVEIAYHRLSASSGVLLAEALQLLFEHLPTAYEDYAWWARALVQVADERPEAAAQAPALRRLAAVLLGTHSLTAPVDASAKQLEAADPAINMLFASSFDDTWPTVSDQDAEIWLTYFESRLKITAGNAEDVATALTELNRCWAELERMRLTGGRRAHLFFRLATELADIHTRLGDLDRALHFSRVATRAARNDNSPTREAFALYKLSNNLKRVGKYRLALNHLNKAISLVGTSNAKGASFYRGRFLLDKAITLTYLNKVAAADQTYEESKKLLADVSPLSYAQLSHRTGWLKRVSGDVAGALRDHEIAVRAMRDIDTMLPHSPDMISSTSYSLARALHSMGNVHAEMGRYDEALACFNEAEELFQRQSGIRHVAIVRKDKAWSQFRQGDAAAAERDLRLSIAGLDFGGDSTQRPAVNSTTHLAEGWLNLSILLMCQGNGVEASTAVDHGLRILSAHDKDNPPLLARLRVQRALLDALFGVDGSALCDQVDHFALTHDPPLHQIAAEVLLVRSVAAATSGRQEDSSRLLDSALARAAEWNTHAATALEERWRLLSPHINELPVTTLPSGEFPMNTATDVGRRAQQPISSADEILDIYDEHGELIGKASHQLAHTIGLWHRAFHCWIVREHDSGPWAGQWTVVLQQRGPGASTYSGFLDISVAGHYQTGEGIEGGLREFVEELGVEPAPADLTLIARRTVNEPAPNNRINREYQDIYVLRSTYSLDTYRPGHPEVSGVFECRLDDLENLIHERVAEIASLTSTGNGAPVWTTVTLEQFIPNARGYHKALLAELRRLGARNGAVPGRTTLEDRSVWEVL